MNRTIWIIVILLVLVGSVFFFATIGKDTLEDVSEANREELISRAQRAGLEVTADSILVDMREINNSDISGVAVLTELEASQTRVAVWLNNAGGTERPVHIHAGSCRSLGDVILPLQNVSNNFSNTTIELSLAELEVFSPLAINAHESSNMMQNNISCGNIDFNQDREIATEEEIDETEEMDEEEDASGDDNNGTTTSTPPPQTVTVTYSASGFSPSTVNITSGQTVRFVNQSGASLWVASDPHPTHHILPAFDSRLGINIGAVYEFAFTTSGSFGYHNHLNPSHRGTVVVQ